MAILVFDTENQMSVFLQQSVCFCFRWLPKIFPEMLILIKLHRTVEWSAWHADEPARCPCWASSGLTKMKWLCSSGFMVFHSCFGPWPLQILHKTSSSEFSCVLITKPLLVTLAYRLNNVYRFPIFSCCVSIKRLRDKYIRRMSETDTETKGKHSLIKITCWFPHMAGWYLKSDIFIYWVYSI